MTDKLSQQAGILCGDDEFWVWLAEKVGLVHDISDRDEAEQQLKWYLEITSFKEFLNNTAKAIRFNKLLTEYDIYRGRQTEPR